MLHQVLISLITIICTKTGNEMRAEATPLKDCFVIHDSLIKDERGYFFESFNKNKFKEQTGSDVNFVQDNQSKSSYGVLRGLHFQRGEHSQAKLVRVLQGKVLDVVVDLRTDSPSYGKHFSIELSENSYTQLFIPKGFAHGFLVLSETAVFFYKCDNFYNKEADGGLIYNDKELNIDWKISSNDIILSDKDKYLPTLQQLGKIF